jgi:hypothetical protein
LDGGGVICEITDRPIDRFLFGLPHLSALLRGSPSRDQMPAQHANEDTAAFMHKENKTVQFDRSGFNELTRTFHDSVFIFFRHHIFEVFTICPLDTNENYIYFVCIFFTKVDRLCHQTRV